MTIASELKVALHEEQLRAYLNQEQVVPVSLEMDITSRCNKGCHNCPSTLSEFQHDMDFVVIKNLFSQLKGHTKGLLISGGEPTLSPIFSSTLAEARRNEFEHIAVVSNGSLLGRRDVRDALIRHGSVLRISIYGWDDGPDPALQDVFEHIRMLRNEIKQNGSSLEIGMSFLTDRSNAAQIKHIVHAVKDAGAHWLYCHPRCEGWDDEFLVQLDQDGVVPSLERPDGQLNGFKVYYFPYRYQRGTLQFSKYHSGHFLMVLGADGNLYLGTETKYNPKHIIGHVDENWRLNDLFNDTRLQALNGMGSHSYFPIGGRHRGCLYNDLIEKLVRKELSLETLNLRAKGMQLKFANIL